MPLAIHAISAGPGLLADGSTLLQRLVLQKILGGHVPAGIVTTVALDLILILAVFLPAVSVLAMLGIWWERKVAGHMQSRLGPNRVGPIGILQSIADGLKLLLKEDLCPKDADGVLFRLAPYLAFAPAFTAFLAIPFGPDFTFEPRLAVGLFWILAILSIEVMGVILAGWASNNKWAVYGAMREACQMVSYEIPLGISILVGVMAAGTLNMVDASFQQGGGIHTWLIFRNPFAFCAFFTYFIASLASNKRAPFDLPESESELVAGFHTEYSGLRFSFFFFAEYAAMFIVASIQTALFLGSWNDPFGLVGHFYQKFAAEGRDWSLFGLNCVAAGIFVTKAIMIVFVQMWIRWTLPRPRIDQVLYACVKVLLPAACVLLLGAGLWQLLVADQPGVPWKPLPVTGGVFNPWNFRQWTDAGAGVALAAQLVLAIIGVSGFSGIVLWITYAAVTGRRHKQRLTEPAPILQTPE
jgi:NADH-quinone oxidoreductase subunit H